MPLQKCMREHTYEEYLIWMDWLDEQWNYPGLTEQYLMQIAAEVRRVLAKTPASIKMKHFKLKFKKTDPNQDPKIAKERSMRYQIQTWMGVLGVAAKKGMDLVKSVLERPKDVDVDEGEEIQEEEDHGVG